MADLAAMPVKLLFKDSEATITLGENAQIIGTGTVGIYATAVADASGKASGSIFSVGYGQAKAHANIDIQSGVAIDAGDAGIGPAHHAGVPLHADEGEGRQDQQQQDELEQARVGADEFNHLGKP